MIGMLKELARLRAGYNDAHTARMQLIEDVKQSEQYKSLESAEKENADRMSEVEETLKEISTAEFEKTGKKKLNDFVTVTVSQTVELVDEDQAKDFALNNPAFMAVDWKELGKYAKAHDLPFYKKVDKVGLRIKSDLSELL